MKSPSLATRATVFSLIALLASACSSSTVIRSNVRGARVYLNDALVGETPYVMRDTKIVGSVTRVRIEAHGYEPLNTIIKRNEEFQAGACIGGIFFLVPFLWIQGYSADHMYELRQPSQYPPPPNQPPPNYNPPGY